MNRATRILAEWVTKIAACDGFTPREARDNDKLAKLRTELDARTRECTELRRQLDAAATAIAALPPRQHPAAQGTQPAAER